MTDIVPYTPYTIEIILESGSKHIIPLHPLTMPDRTIISIWLRSKSSDKTVVAYAREINRFYATIGKTLHEITLEDLYDFRDSLAHLKTTSKHRALAAVKSLFSKARRTGYLDINVAEAFELPKIENKLAERIMTEQAMQDILKRETNQRNHAILSLLYYGGLRVSEVCNLTWRNLQERDQAGQIAVYGKGKKTRHILLDTDTWLEVLALRKHEPIEQYVFLSRQTRSRANKQDKRMSEVRVFQIVEDAALRAGIATYEDTNKKGEAVAKSHVSPHWFRHAHATHALDRGATLPMVQADLGHENIETTGKYLHVRPGVSVAAILRKKEQS